jgi:ATP-dependent helicase/nuclease subunit B
MGSKDAAAIDLWLRDGGLVVAANERAARAASAAFHRARRAEGLDAWPAPNIQDWRSFIRGAWQARSFDDRLMLNALQEEWLWAEMVSATGPGEVLLAASRHRMATLAMEAHELLCDFAPEFLNERARSGWRQDAEAFSNWLAEIERTCSSDRLISAARLPLELLPVLDGDAEQRPALLLVGFDRLLPVQRRVFDAWGTWREAPLGEPAPQPRFYAASDAQTELAACALWCNHQLACNPQPRLLVVAQNARERRGAIERAFLRFAGRAELFEFSLGVPLSQVALVRGARLVLRWFSDPIEEHELDWLISTEQTADAAESRTLAAFMRAVRRRGWEQPHWRLDDFLRQRPGIELPPAWAARMTHARRMLERSTQGSIGAMPGGGRTADPFTWAELVPQLLEAAGWLGARPLTSAEFQALRRWQRALDECASLGFNGRRVSWGEFLLVLGEALETALFAPESRNAPIQIAGPAESAGLIADGVWFLGGTEDSWPAPGATHPLLPFAIQRQAAMPHSSPQLDWDVSRSVTMRLLASAPEVLFSFARQNEDIEMRPSRLIAQMAGAPEPLPSEYLAPCAPMPIAVAFQDFSRIALRASEAPGGSSVLTAQSQCAFKAFAVARLGAQSWGAAQAGLTAAQRGQLLHAVLHAIWAGPPSGIRSHGELVAIGDRRHFVEEHARNALRTALPPGVLHRMSQRYLELEKTRLVDLVVEWLAFEATRIPFVVAGVEINASPSIAGLGLHLRFDRIDRLADGSLLVIDYKSGNVSPKAWELPRPDDVQMPLYAIFGLDEDLRAKLGNDSRDVAAANIDADSEGRLGGLVFGKVRAGEHCFAGRVGDAKAMLLSDVPAGSALAKRNLTAEELMAWREYIEQMAQDFLAGRADVDPRQYPQTCERCDLHALCRIQEGQAQIDESETEEASDE